MAETLQRLGRLGAELLIALAALALLVAIAEGFLRLFAPVPSPLPSSNSEEGADLPRLHRTEDLARPGVRGLNAGALYETNADGFRGPVRSARKPPGVSRVAVIGDSTAMGWGVREEDTYAARLENRLNQDPGSDSFEVLNFALAGLNAEEVVTRLEDLGLDYDPDIVVYGYALNDIKGPHYRKSLDPEYVRDVFLSESSSRLWQAIRPIWLALQERIFTPRGSFAYELDDNYFRNPEALETVEEQISRLAQLGRKHGFCTVVLVQAQIDSLNMFHPYERHYDVVRDVAEAEGTYPLESFDRLAEEEASDLWVNDLDHHANDRGHAIFAEILAEGLDQLPEACWEDDPESPPLNGEASS